MSEVNFQNTWNITRILRGIAIIVVLINHFLNDFTRDYIKLSGYANGLIAIFYFLSGFGIHLSLEKRFEDKKLNTRDIAIYYFDRFYRIYPIYILTLIFNTIYYGVNYDLIVYLGLEGPYRFVHLILQCYFVSFLLYLLLKKLGAQKFLITLISIFIVVNFIFYEILTLPKSLIYLFFYRNLLFGNVMLFSIGMALPQILEETIESPFTNKRHTELMIASAILFIVFVYLTRSSVRFYYMLDSYIFILLATPFFIYFTLFNQIKNPIENNRFIFRFLFIFGTYSWSLYLFSFGYYQILYDYEFIQSEPLSRLIFGIIFAIMFFPILFLICYLLENAFVKLRTMVIPKKSTSLISNNKKL